MALDGAFLACIKDELISRLPEARVDKIHQPARDELLLLLRYRGGSEKVMISASPNAPRIHFTAQSPENPAQPPMFCMLLRKHLTGGKLIAIRQEALERALYWDFDCINELGDPVRLTLAVELIGRYSNVILIGNDGKIIDAMKRVDPAMSPLRPILPGIRYEVPPYKGQKMDVSRFSKEEILVAVQQQKEVPLSKAIQNVTLGISPLICRELAFRATAGEDTVTTAMTKREWEKLAIALDNLQNALIPGGKRTPYRLWKTDGTPLEFSFMPIIQYGLSARGEEADSFSALLDDFFAKRALDDRMKAHSRDLLRVLSNATDRIHRKIANQRQDLEHSAKRDTWRLYGDLINTSLHTIPAGADKVDLVNYYDENCATVTVPLNPALSAVANAQRYYKEYRKAQTAEEILVKRIAEGEQELIYIDSVFDALSRATTTRELEELRCELEEQGYLHRPKGKGKVKSPPPLKPLSFCSDDGFRILVGRNNMENDRLTLKTAKGNDMWLHTKNIPGSHVIIQSEGQPIPDSTVEQAAIIAATHSKAADSVQVPVEYTLARFVKKPAGAKPGMVIYTDNSTAFVNPDEALCYRLAEENR